MPPAPSADDVAEQIQALKATVKLVFITLDEICQAQGADDSLQPMIQLLKDQAKLPHS